MAATFRVSPERLRDAARAQLSVAEFVSGMAAGQSLSAAGAGVRGLLSATASAVAGGLFDNAASAVHDELTGHSTKLTAAAGQYDRVDEEYGRRLRAPRP